MTTSATCVLRVIITVFGTEDEPVAFEVFAEDMGFKGSDEFFTAVVGAVFAGEIAGTGFSGIVTTGSFGGSTMAGGFAVVVAAGPAAEGLPLAPRWITGCLGCSLSADSLLCFVGGGLSVVEESSSEIQEKCK